MSAVEIERCDDPAGGSLSHLLLLLWSPDAALNARHIHWKYQRNPYGGSCVYVARAGERIVAMRGFYGARYVTGDAEGAPRVMCAGDLVIAPDYRGRGVFTQIMTRAKEDLAGRGVEFLLNFSANDRVRLGSLAAGWGTTGPVRELRRLDPERGKTGLVSRLRREIESDRHRRIRDSAIAVARSLQKSGSVAGTLVRRLTRWTPFASLDRMPPIDGDVAISSRERPGDMADLLRRVEVDGRIRQLRDETYFQWRFGSPLSAYRFFFLGCASLDAYLVLQARHHPVRGKVIRVADWVGVSNETRAAVLKSALRALPRGQIEIWASSIPDEDRALLRESGFEERVLKAGEFAPAALSLPLASPIPQRPWKFGGRDILDIHNWNLRLIDSDGC